MVKFLVFVEKDIVYGQKSKLGNKDNYVWFERLLVVFLCFCLFIYRQKYEKVINGFLNYMQLF